MPRTVSTVDKTWPEAVAVFAAYYGEASLVLVPFRDELDSQHVRIVESSTGLHMGCILGSIGFDIVSDHAILSPLSAEFPQFPIVSITDDNQTCIAKQDSDADWQETYAQYKLYLDRFEELGEPVGIKKAEGKTKLLLPPGAPLPSPPIPGVIVTYEGMVVAGSPVGTDEFIRTTVKDKINDKVGQLESLEAFGDAGVAENQAGFSILTLCHSHSLTYLARTTPTNLLLEAAPTFDAAFEKTRLALLGTTTEEVDATSAERLERAHRLARLPTKRGGAAQPALVDTAGAAFVAGFLASCSHPGVFHTREALAPPLAQAHASILARIDTDDLGEGKALAKLLPPDPRDFTTGDFVPAFLEKSPASGVQKLLGTSIANHAHARLLDATHHTNAEFSPSSTFTPADALHFAEILDRPDASKIFSASIAIRSHRLASADFTTKARHHFNLPQRLRNQHNTGPSIHSTAIVDRCTHSYCTSTATTAQRPQPELDLSGGHAHGCPGSGAATTRRHNEVRDIIEMYGRSAGLSACSEPPCAFVLQGRFTDKECGACFPGTTVTKAADVTAGAALCLELEKAFALPPGRARTDALAEADAKVQEIDGRLNVEGQTDFGGRHPTGIQVDVLLSDQSRGIEMLVDVSGTNYGNYDSDMMRRGFARLVRAQNAEAQGVSPAVKDITPLPITTREKSKATKYQHVLACAKRQHSRGERPTLPTFKTFAFTPAGTFGPQAEEVIEFLIEHHRLQTRANSPGSSANQLGMRTGAFAHGLRSDLRFAIARGTARVIRAGGRCRSS
jgi:hypothetical protein